jgi:putative Mg2+ transporter-C (MgtC) family protein
MFGRGGDPSRIASNIVTGIGFLGAGTIIRQGSTVRGLTTAASLWSVSAIGLAVGMGGQMYILAATAAVLVLAVLSWVDILEDRLVSAERYLGLSMILSSHEHDPTPIINKLAALGVQVLGVKSEMEEDGKRVMRLRLKLQPHVSQDQVNAVLAELEVIEGFDWE